MVAKKETAAQPRRKNSRGRAPAAPVSGISADALFGSARVSVLLNLLHRLLSEHELKLTLCLLESLADSKISVSLLSVQMMDLQKALLSFCSTRRKQPSQSGNKGLQLIEDLCISSLGQPNAQAGRKKFQRSQTIGHHFDDKRSSQLSATSTGTSAAANQKPNGPARGLAKPSGPNLLAAPKAASQSTPSTAVHTPSTSLPATPRGSVGPGVAEQRAAEQKAAEQKSMHQPPPLPPNNGSAKSRGAPNGSHRGSTDSLASANSLATVVPGVPENMRCDHGPAFGHQSSIQSRCDHGPAFGPQSSIQSSPQLNWGETGSVRSLHQARDQGLMWGEASSIRSLHQVRNQGLTWGERTSIPNPPQQGLAWGEASSIRSLQLPREANSAEPRPPLPLEMPLFTPSSAWRIQPTADGAKIESTGSTCANGDCVVVEDTTDSKDTANAADGTRQVPVPVVVKNVPRDSINTTTTAGATSEWAPECPLGGHNMAWCNENKEFICSICARGQTDKHWYCQEHLLNCCRECVDIRTSHVGELNATAGVIHGLENLQRGSMESYQTSTAGFPFESRGDVSDSSSEEDWERPEVKWNDELDDLSAVQVAWLATPSGWLMQHPNGMKRMLWDVLALIFIVLDCVTLPLKLCFSIGMPTWTSWTSCVFFFLDMVLNFNTGYFHESILIMRRGMVARHYIRTWFFLDFIATMPWEEVISGFAGDDDTGGGEHTLLRLAKLSRYMRCIRLLRVMKVQKLMDRFQEMQWFNAHSGAFAFSIIQMLSIFGMLCHWAACIFGFIGEQDNFGAADDPHNWKMLCVPGGPCEAGIIGTPWRHRYGLDNYDLGTQYLMALHFATGLVTGGELALQPGFWLERVYVVIMMIMGLFVCSAVLSQVLVLITKKAEENIELNEQVWAVKNFMMVRKVPPELQSKVRRYLETQTKLKKEGNDYDAMDYLSPALRTELIEYLNRKVITKHPFFAQMSMEAIQSICVQAVPTMFAPGDVVVEEGQLALSMDFVVRGKLKVEGMSKIVYLSTGSWLGDRCLFVDTQRSHTVSAVTSCEVLCVQKRVVVAVCSEYPQMQTHYDQFQKRVCDGEHLLLCSICNQPGHADQDCPENPSRKVTKPDVATSSEGTTQDRRISTFVKQTTKKFLGDG